MNKRHIYPFIGVIVTGQIALSFNSINHETEKINTIIESVEFQKYNNKLEAKVYQKTNTKNVTKVTYKYKKKKNFKNIENSIISMKKQTDKYHGANKNNKLTQPSKIAKTLSGKLLIGQA
ncbi:hypothetical protein [Companilactobacillus sp. DQM5]|uniref:hypothetical protein n=1 Tax=Companilactobacillus sp. DQM5 TaxID=3463359 RepID=UPI00405A4023